ncbi:MAG: SGNH/GDSL hydrolase family protein [Gammaproteobacteria bacterium]|nr:SGNH/GDSL hydrolase family protein [Gammaproteobacteria bacterium]MCP5426906.1 SGNH/GDSL hydrolase family protein [Chromatiaceae bacterium]
MQQILVYSDSLTWGIIPNTRKRLPFTGRWPGVMEHRLNRRAPVVRVIENSLNGRRTVWEDPFKPGRNGLHGLAQCIEINSPLALAILMLGTNDFQSMHPHNAWHASQGMAALIGALRQAPVEPGMPIPPVIIVAPPPVEAPQGPIAPKFAGAETKCLGLAEAYQELARELDCHFLDAGSITPASRVDGIHLDADQHQLLGEAMADRVASILLLSSD